MPNNPSSQSIDLSFLEHFSESGVAFEISARERELRTTSEKSQEKVVVQNTHELQAETLQLLGTLGLLTAIGISKFPLRKSKASVQ